MKPGSNENDFTWPPVSPRSSPPASASSSYNNVNKIQTPSSRAHDHDPLIARQNIGLGQLGNAHGLPQSPLTTTLPKLLPTVHNEARREPVPRLAPTVIMSSPSEPQASQPSALKPSSPQKDGRHRPPLTASQAFNALPPGVASSSGGQAMQAQWDAMRTANPNTRMYACLSAEVGTNRCAETKPKTTETSPSLNDALNCSEEKRPSTLTSTRHCDRSESQNDGYQTRTRTATSKWTQQQRKQATSVFPIDNARAGEEAPSCTLPEIRVRSPTVQLGSLQEPVSSSSQEHRHQPTSPPSTNDRPPAILASSDSPSAGHILIDFGARRRNLRARQCQSSSQRSAMEEDQSDGNVALPELLRRMLSGTTASGNNQNQFYLRPPPLPWGQQHQLTRPTTGVGGRNEKIKDWRDHVDAEKNEAPDPGSRATPPSDVEVSTNTSDGNGSRSGSSSGSICGTGSRKEETRSPRPAATRRVSSYRRKPSSARVVGHTTATATYRPIRKTPTADDDFPSFGAPTFLPSGSTSRLESSSSSCSPIPAVGGISTASTASRRTSGRDLSIDEILNLLPHNGIADPVMFGFVNAQVRSARGSSVGGARSPVSSKGGARSPAAGVRSPVSMSMKSRTGSEKEKWRIEEEGEEVVKGMGAVKWCVAGKDEGGRAVTKERGRTLERKMPVAVAAVKSGAVVSG